VMVGQGAKILVDQRDKSLQGVFVTSTPTGEELADDLRRVLGQLRPSQGLRVR